MERTATPVIDGQGGVSPMMAGIPLALNKKAISELEESVLRQQAFYRLKREEAKRLIEAEVAQMAAGMSAQEQAYMRNQYEQGLQMAQMTRGMA